MNEIMILGRIARKGLQKVKKLDTYVVRWEHTFLGSTHKWIDNLRALWVTTEEKKA